MKILVINCGSSSIKYKLYEFPSRTLIAGGLIERIGEKTSTIKNHSYGVSAVLSDLIKSRAIADLSEIAAVGHRVVHGGETFRRPHIIDAHVIRKIKECSVLAPLHNPANLAGIMGCRSALPKTPAVAVFDTAFYQTISQTAYLYPIPLEYYRRDRVRRYGFHGTSHQYVALQAAKKLKKPMSKVKLITCHLGNGCSITAIDRGKAIETSMGFTPLEGLMMGTRSGSIDVAAVFYLMEKKRLSIAKMEDILNRKSGLLGVSGVSNDVRVLKKEMKKGNKRARLAWDMFMYRIKLYIGAYRMLLGGADAVCFTAGIGENCPSLVDTLRKDIRRVAGTKTKVFAIPTNEELMIAQLTHSIVKRRKK